MRFFTLAAAGFAEFSGKDSMHDQLISPKSESA
jgi:hypothetical protein